jgi:hypothetical protein
MANMSYCRFENTYRALLDCSEHFEDEGLSSDEEKYRKRMIELCQNIVDSYPEEDE